MLSAYGSRFGSEDISQFLSQLFLTENKENLLKTCVFRRFLVAEAGLEPTTSGLWAAVYITFSANNRQFGAFPGCLPPPAIHWNLPRPLRADPVWVKTWVRSFSLTRSKTMPHSKVSWLYHSFQKLQVISSEKKLPPDGTIRYHLTAANNTKWINKIPSLTYHCTLDWTT